MPRTFRVPTYLIASVPFRRRSGTSTASSTTITTSSSIADDNSDRRSSESTTTTATSSSSSATSTSPTSNSSNQRRRSPYLNGHASILRCTRCLSHICSTSQIISKGFTGQHGRAYLVASTNFAYKLPDGDQSSKRVTSLANTRTHVPRPRALVTGMHTVADLVCSTCGLVLGWKYIAAEEEREQYKVGKFILETKCVVRNACWEEEADDDDNGEDGGNKYGLGSWEGDVAELKGLGMEKGEEEVVEFDSEDEAECEALFSGEWSAGLARSRRRKKGRTMSAHC